MKIYLHYDIIVHSIEYIFIMISLYIHFLYINSKFNENIKFIYLHEDEHYMFISIMC